MTKKAEAAAVAAQTKTDASEPPRSLFAALLEAQRAIGSVGKDSRNDFHKYRYVSAEAMISACRAALSDGGLTVRRRSWELTSDGLFVVSKFEIAYALTGESTVDTVPWAIVVEKGKPADKALASALTTSLSYWLRDLLLLPREEEDAMDQRNDKAVETVQGIRRQPPTVANVSALNERVRAVRDTAPTPPASFQTVAVSVQAEQPKPKPKAEPRSVVGTVEAVWSRDANGTAWQFLSILSDGGTPAEYLVDRAVGDVSDLNGKRVSANVQDRDGKSGLVLSIAEVDAATGEILF
jgi:hypothetical protein